MASVISSSPRGDGLMAFTASKIVASNMYTPTSARSEGGVFGFSMSRTTLPSRSSATPNWLGLGTAREQDLAVGLLLAESRDQRRQLLADQVVAQVHAEGVGAEEGLGDEDGVRQPERRLLLDVRDRDAEAAAVAHGVPDLLARVADHDADLDDAGGGQRLDPVEEDGLVGDGDELLGRREGDGSEPGPAPAGEDEPFHGLTLSFRGRL